MTFGELVGSMVCGPGAPDVFRGVVRRVGDGAERRYRLARRGDLSREERLDGTVLRIVGQHASWFRDQEVDLMRVRQHESDVTYAHAPIGGLDVGGPRPSWERWTGTDFTRPTGPVVETEFLGRPAWAVELAPPSHKPYPLQLVVDAPTGLVLRKTNEGFGIVEEWVELEFDPDLPDALFAWDGPAQPVPSQAERQAEWQAEEAERSAWLARRGLATLPLSFDCDLFVHESDEKSGSFYASVDVTASGAVIRRPHSDAPWHEPETANYPHSWRWSDGAWDWFFATELPLTGSGVASIRAHLAASS